MNARAIETGAAPDRGTLTDANRAIADAHALYARWQRQLAHAPESARASAYGYEYEARWRDVLDLLPALAAWEEAEDVAARQGPGKQGEE